MPYPSRFDLVEYLRHAILVCAFVTPPRGISSEGFLYGGMAKVN